MLATIPRHLSLSCRYRHTHKACGGTVRVGGPGGVTVPCQCPTCNHPPARIRTTDQE